MSALVFLGDCTAVREERFLRRPTTSNFHLGLVLRGPRSEKTVIRGGYGINFAPPILGMGFNFPYSAGFTDPIRLFRDLGEGSSRKPVTAGTLPYPAFTQQLPNTIRPSETAIQCGLVPARAPQAAVRAKLEHRNQRELPWHVPHSKLTMFG